MLTTMGLPPEIVTPRVTAGLKWPPLKNYSKKKYKIIYLKRIIGIKWYGFFLYGLY